jgi:hypothetical protein
MNKGAIEFFKKSVKEAGQKRLVKLIVFKLWKNSYKRRCTTETLLKKAIDKMYLRSVAAESFQAWKRLTAETVMARKDKKVSDLNSKIQQLEEVIRKLNGMITTQD